MRSRTQVPGQQGRRFVIPGANGGLGLATAQIVAPRGASVVLACRNLERAWRRHRSCPATRRDAWRYAASTGVDLPASP